MKRHRRIRIRPLGALFLLIIALLLVLTVVLVVRLSGGGDAEQAGPAETVIPDEGADLEAETPAMPAATAEPSIMEDWYLERCAQLRRYLTAYGGYEDEAAVEAAIEAMNIDPDGKMVAITFDDGPDPYHTPRILETLRQYNARATFFVLGQQIPGNYGILEDILGAGCEIGNHTQAHTDLRAVSAEEAREAIVAVNETLKELFDYDVKLLRPPYGSYKTDDDRIKTLARELGLSIIMWRRSTDDSLTPRPTVDQIVERALAEWDENGTGLNGAIILFHDRYDETVEAIARIVPALQEQGYQLVTVSELLQTDEGGMNPGGVYRFKG